MTPDQPIFDQERLNDTIALAVEMGWIRIVEVPTQQTSLEDYYD